MISQTLFLTGKPDINSPINIVMIIISGLVNDISGSLPDWKGGHKFAYQYSNDNNFWACQ